MYCPPVRPASGKSGAALIIVLGIVTLLSVMVIAFLGTTSKNADLSRKTTVEAQSVDLVKLAKSQIEFDLNQEMRAGSVEPRLSSGTAGGSSLSAGTISVLALYPATP